MSTREKPVSFGLNGIDPRLAVGARLQQTVSLLTGQRVTSTLPVTASMVEAFTEFSGDRNPLHVDAEAARTLGMPRRVAHGAILLAEVSRIIGMEMPGHGALWLSSQFDFRKPVFVGDTVQLEVQVEHHSPALGVVVLAIRVVNARDETVLEGSANVKLLEGVMPLAYTPLEKQTVLVTGGTRGLGAEISRFLAERGATVIAAFRTDEEAATALKDDLTSEAASRLHTVRCDIQDEAQVDALFARLAEEGRTLDSVVHAASPAISDVPFTELSWDHFDPFLKTYVKGGLLLAQAAAKQFEGVEAGRFVLIGSEAVTSPRRGWLHYVTAKSAYVGLVRGLATELAEVGATANLVSPGVLHASDVLGDHVKMATRNATPLKRLVSGEEVAAVVGFLLEAGGSFMTGADVPLSGGRVFS